MKVARLRRQSVPHLSSPSGVGGGTALPALDDLTDVDAPSPSDGDVLIFDSGSGTWVPGSVVTPPATSMWVPVMTEDTSTGFWYVVVTGDGDAVMTEVPL